ncbi:MAG: hypothetical protein CM15mP76_12310 [Prochlorococcus sp.]|nr:MAG: hypothetical protein CM15mP76_12310 [Prochlorococcus sp.]
MIVTVFPPKPFLYYEPGSGNGKKGGNTTSFLDGGIKGFWGRFDTKKK